MKGNGFSSSFYILSNGYEYSSFLSKTTPLEHALLSTIWAKCNKVEI